MFEYTICSQDGMKYVMCGESLEKVLVKNKHIISRICGRKVKVSPIKIISQTAFSKERCLYEIELLCHLRYNDSKNKFADTIRLMIEEKVYTKAF